MSSHLVENVPDGVDPSVRMNGNERFQHVVMFVSFTVLAVTGFTVHLPRGLVRLFGDQAPALFDFRGAVHRISGVVLIAVSVYHAFYLAFTRRGRWQLRELLPRRRDASDFVSMLRHYRDPAIHPKPQFGWFNYMEKAEYWALVWGTFIMALSGFALWLEEFGSKTVLDVALVVHRYEAILAALAVIVWHFYHVHLAPDVFPMSPIWLTGRARERRSTPEG